MGPAESGDHPLPRSHRRVLGVCNESRQEWRVRSPLVVMEESVRVTLHDKDGAVLFEGDVR